MHGADSDILLFDSDIDKTKRVVLKSIWGRKRISNDRNDFSSADKMGDIKRLKSRYYESCTKFQPTNRVFFDSKNSISLLSILFSSLSMHSTPFWILEISPSTLLNLQTVSVT